MRWFFDISKVKESSFFKSDLTDPPSDFWCASFGNYRFKPFQISFFSGFYIKIMFWVRWFYSLFERMRLKRKRTMFIHTNQPLFTSFYIKRYLFFAELAMSQRWSAIFCATGAWGGKPIGRVRVKSLRRFRIFYTIKKKQQLPRFFWFEESWDFVDL